MPCRKGWAQETQVLTWVLSFDPDHPPEPLAITAAGAALALSGERQPPRQPAAEQNPELSTAEDLLQ